MAKKTYDLLFKLLLIGDSGVGKTCILFRYVCLFFVGEAIWRCKLNIKVNIFFLDSAMMHLHPHSFPPLASIYQIALQSTSLLKFLKTCQFVKFLNLVVFVFTYLSIFLIFTVDKYSIIYLFDNHSSARSILPLNSQQITLLLPL